MKVTSHTCSPTWVTPTFWPADERPATIFTSRPTKRYGLVNMALPATVFSAGTSSDRKSTRLNSSHSQISYAVFCLKKKKKKKHIERPIHTRRHVHKRYDRWLSQIYGQLKRL